MLSSFNVSYTLACLQEENDADAKTKQSTQRFVTQHSIQKQNGFHPKDLGKNKVNKGRKKACL